jgi:POT family proton-dependent oligopeptide transporter
MGMGNTTQAHGPGEEQRFGHPKGLTPLAGTELAERISFHGMLALLTLYMAQQLLLPGHIEKVIGFAGYRAAVEAVTGPLTVDALAAQTFGFYAGFIYFTPVVGGWLGDRFIGRRAAVLTGAVLMALGHLAMAFEASFLIALLLLIAGAGFLRGNLISQVGSLYPPGDPRLGSGIQIYYAMVNIGGFVAPIATGLLAQAYGWHWGFGFAGIGMVAGVVVYLAGMRHLPPDPPRRRKQDREPLTAADRRSVVTLLALLPLLTLFWVAQTQIWNVYNLWVDGHVDLGLFGWRMPVPWIQAISSMTSVAMVPPVLMVFGWLHRRGQEPDDIVKLGIGCLIFSVFVFADAVSNIVFAPGKVPLFAPVLTQFGQSFGYLFVQPVAIALYTRCAPRPVNAMMIGVYFLSIFAGSIISGRLGSLYDHWSPAAFWALHGALIGAGGFGLLALAPAFRRGLGMPTRALRMALAAA